METIYENGRRDARQTLTSMTTVDSQGYGYTDDAEAANRKRSSRACDQCRKVKSKCDRGPTDDGPCRNCAISGITCTYQGPSYKRGPPKGYIHAIEHRLHLVESVLASIISSQDIGALSVVKDLRNDDVASAIIDRVSAGPFGFSARSNMRHLHKTEPLGFDAAAFAEESRLKGDKALRDSRHNRELVSTEQEALPSPTLEWQEQLIARIGSNSKPSTSTGTPSRRRRVSEAVSAARQPTPYTDINGLYVADPLGGAETQEGEDELDTAEAFGKLSLDENQQIRYHGESSGMPLLDRLSGRTDGRNMGGLWQIPMSRFWPRANRDRAGLLDVRLTYADLMISSPAKQDFLIDLYFLYVHTSLPVVDQQSFAREYAARVERYNISAPQQRLSAEETTFELLLQSMLSIAGRYEISEEPLPEHGAMWEAGCDHMASARQLLDTLYHVSNIKTCQSLLILGYREFGLGSLEQGWLFVGSAIRMAQDLGLNHTADKWQRLGIDLFTPAQKHERKQLWWGCAIVDKYLAMHLGRPPAISERNYDTDYPNDAPEEDAKVWMPHSTAQDKRRVHPVAVRTTACFKSAASLSVIIGRIIEKLYAVRRKPAAVIGKYTRELESQLQQWLVGLPESLTYYISSNRPVPPPHILMLHCQYWSTVILLHRRFIPQKQSAGTFLTASSISLSGSSLKAFDLCQNAANRITNLATVMSTTFGLRQAPLTLVSNLLSAGIMHVATLIFRPHDPQASIYLQQVLVYLKELEIPWPGAALSWELITGANVELMQMANPAERQRFNKRGAADAFNEEELQPAASSGSSSGTVSLYGDVGIGGSSPGDMNAMMAEMLGFDVPAMQSVASQTSQIWPSELSDAARTLAGFSFESFTRSSLT